VRRRLLLVLLAFSLAAVAGFAGPLLESTAANRTQQFVLSRTTDVARLTALAQEAAAGGDPARLEGEVRAHTELFGDAVVIVDARRRDIAANGMRADEPRTAAALDAALRNQPAEPPPTLRPWSGGDVLFTQPIGTGTRVTGAVVLRSSVTPAVDDIRVRWALVLLGALAAAVVCALLALRLASWVLRPVEQLAQGVRTVISGDEPAPLRDSAGPPELRELVVSFNRMSAALTESSKRQRDLVDDASHQLRNPLAALRLRIDTLAGQVGAGGQDGYRSVVVELERLEALLDGMLALASADSTATDLAAGEPEPSVCDVAGVLAERVGAWSAAADAAGVRIDSPGTGRPALARFAEGVLAQVIDVVLDNAIKYAGAGATVACGYSTSGGRVAVTVTDDGPGVAPDELNRVTQRFWRSGRHRTEPGSGLGLAIADRLVTAREGLFEVSAPSEGGLRVRVELAEVTP